MILFDLNLRLVSQININQLNKMIDQFIQHPSINQTINIECKHSYIY